VRTADDLNAAIIDWARVSTNRFRDEGDWPSGEGPYAITGEDAPWGAAGLYVVKYFGAKYLSAFQADKRLVISATPGFTWGDGVYVAPASCPLSTMMYGRVGAMGWVAREDIGNVYDASDIRGQDLYQDWVTRRSWLFGLLTTTIHADWANRRLRNLFRQTFNIGLVHFHPDQFNDRYVRRGHDRWYVLSDWPDVGTAVGAEPGRTNLVQDCRWVAIVWDEFEPIRENWEFADLIAPSLFQDVTPRERLAGRATQVARLWDAYTSRRPVMMPQTRF